MPLHSPPIKDRPELTGFAYDFLETTGPDLLKRWSAHQEYWDIRTAAGLDPYFRTTLQRIGPATTVRTGDGEHVTGINFGSQDYLSLSSHPKVQEAATEAIGRWGVHSAGSIGLQGTTSPMQALEEKLAETLCLADVAIFPTGWAAGYGIVKTLVRDTDHIVMDALAHACLQEGAANATKQIHRVTNCATGPIEQRLARIRQRDAGCGILVVTEALFSMDSTTPDLAALQDLCRRYNATLLVDIAHDFGAIGDGGLGFIGEQGMLGDIDVVIGSFSKTFASNGGFVGGRLRGIKQALRVFANPLLFSNALSPVQASVANAALGIVRSREGAERRQRLMRNILRLRDGLAQRSFRVLGAPSAIVPVWLGNAADARLVTREALRRGALVNLVEHPVVSRQNSRWRLQVMADHTTDQIDRLIDIAADAREVVQPGQRARPIEHALESVRKLPIGIAQFS